MQDDDGFDKAFLEGFEEDNQETPPANPPKEEPAEGDDNKPEADPKDPKGDETLPKEETEETDENTPPENEEDEEGATKEPPKEDPKKEEAEEPKPLTREDVTSILSDIRTEERNSTKELETTTDEVLKAYYPEGLSNTLIDKNTGKELKTPQDVVEATNGQMSTEEAAQWLMNEQYELDQDVKRIKDDAHKIAETTVNFKRDAEAAIAKYEPLFKWQPHLQRKVYDKLMQQVKADVEKGVVLSAPDVMDHYDFYLEPYQKAFEYSQNKPATNPVPDNTPPAPKPSAEDRMDDGGDAGATPVDDPNDFAQQVNKELSKGI